METVEAFRKQAVACGELGSPMYRQLLDRIADDLEHGGVSQSVLEGHENDPGPSALALRLLGSVHRLVLDSQAPELAVFYPSVGGDWNLRSGWRAFQGLLRDQPARVRAWLDQPPQTNEVGRAAALMGGLLRIGETHRLPVRLVEIGASGGLNLRADRFFYVGFGGWGYGPEESPVQLTDAWRGRRLEPWAGLAVAERLGCDTLPVDVSSDEGRLTLMSYVWPDQKARLQRLQDAFDVADEVQAEVRRQDAASFVRQVELVDGTTTVLWHSVMWQYLPEDDKSAVNARITQLGAQAKGSAPFAHLFLEPTRRAPGSDHEFLVVLQIWPDGGRRILGTAAPHGLPTTWE